MILDLKNTLLKIREERESELIKTRIGIVDDAEKKRKAILTLELPFKTDHVEIMKARGQVQINKEHQSKNNITPFSAEATTDWKMKREEGQLVIGRKHQSKYNTSKLASTAINEFCNRSKNRNTRKSLNNFCSLLDENGLFRDKSSRTALQMAKNLPLEYLMTIIEKSENLPSSTKDTYKSYAKSLHYFLIKEDYQSPSYLIQKNSSILYDIAHFFAFLENRALKSTTIRAYEDLLLCRAVFYISLQTTTLFSLELKEENLPYISSQDNTYILPQSFIKLWRCFNLPTRLFLKKLDERLLHQKIRRLGEYAKISITLTPTILRSAMKSICINYLLIDVDVMKQLPKR